MARILCVGVATLDIILDVDQFPAENSEQRATSCVQQRGGNAANSAVVLAQFDHQVDWLGSVANDQYGDFILDDLQCHGVGTAYVERQDGVTPLSTIWRSANNGSRTIVHYRQLPELSAQAFAQVALKEYDWVHFEARHCSVTAQLMRQVRHTKLSLEVEKPRPQLQDCLNLPAQVQIFSRDYVTRSGYTQADDFLKQLPGTAGQIQVSAWGEQGAYGRLGDGACVHVPAVPLKRVVDSVGAGDTFNAGLIHAMLQGRSLRAALAFANDLAACKCGQTGYRGLAESLQAV